MMEDISPVVFIPAVGGAYKEYFSSDETDSSMDEYSDHDVDSHNQFTSHLEDDDDDIYVSRKLKHNVDSRTPPTSESDEVETVHCFSAKRKIDSSKKRTADGKNVSAEVFADEARSVHQLRPTSSTNNNAVNEEVDSPKVTDPKNDIKASLRSSTRSSVSETIRTSNDVRSTGRSMRPRRNTDSATPTAKEKDLSAPELSKKTTVYSKSSNKPSQLKMGKIALQTTVEGSDCESGSRYGRLLRSRKESESQCNTAPSPSNGEKVVKKESKVKEKTNHMKAKQKTVTRSDSESGSKHGRFNLRSRTKSESRRKTAPSPSNDEKLMSQELEANEETNRTRLTREKLQPASSKTENKSKRHASVADEDPVKMKLRRDGEVRSSQKSIAIVLSNCNGTNESTPTKRRPTRALRSVVPFGVELADNPVKSTPLTRSTRATRSASAAPRNVDRSTPCTRSKDSNKQPVSCTMNVVDYNDDDDTSDDNNYVPSSSDSSQDESSVDDSDDDVPTSDGSSGDKDSGEDSDDVFYPARSSLRARNPETPKTPRTPRTPKVNVRGLTPSLPSRTKSLSTPLTPKDRAMKALHISSVPESLPCRNREYQTIYNFLLKKLKGIDGGFMYVYGVPGAGKTATVERVIKRLQMESKGKKINNFTFVDINGMHLRQPKDAYCHIWKKLEKCSVSALKAKCLLERKFQTLFVKQTILLLIDEFDMLFNKTFSVIDTLLDWVDQSKLIVVGIANSKDLIEEIGRSSTKSRMFRERLCDVQFETYTYKQLQEIIEDRLKKNEVFTRDAVELLARKSALSGDVRLALNLCRRVLAEAGDVDVRNAIDAEKVVELLEKVHKDPKIGLIKSLGKQNHILLRAIRDVILHSGLPSCSLARNLYDHYKTLCILDGVRIRNEVSLFRNLRLLESYAIVTLSESDCTIHTEISLENNIDLIQLVFLPEKRH